MGEKSDIIKALLNKVKENIKSLEEEGDLEAFNNCPYDLFDLLVKKLDMAAILINEVDEAEF